MSNISFKETINTEFRLVAKFFNRLKNIFVIQPSNMLFNFATQFNDTVKFKKAVINESTLDVAGTTTTSTLTASGNISTTGVLSSNSVQTSSMQIGSGISATDSAADLKILGDVYTLNNLTVDGNSTIGGNESIAGTLTTTGNFTCNGTFISEVQKYAWDIRVSNFYATTTANYVPLPGYVIERTGTAGNNEFIGMVAPYDGILVRASFRSEEAQNGIIIYNLYKSTDGTETPGTDSMTKNQSVKLSDDTTVHTDFSTLDSGSNSITKGEIIAVKITTPSAPNDSNLTLVFRWDLTT